MLNILLNIAMVALVVSLIVSIIRAVALPRGAPERLNAILRVVCSLVGIGFILAFRYTSLSAWHYIIVGGALILIQRELQNQHQARMSIYGSSRKCRLAFIVGIALGAVVCIHAPWVLRLALVGLLIVVLIKRPRPRPVTRPGPEPYFGGIVKPKEETQEEPLPAQNDAVQVISDATHTVDSDQVTASYAHPSTGIAHTDAALQVYVSSEDGPAKSRARRIIIAGLTKTTAFRTEDEELNAALNDIVKTGDPDTLKDKLQALSERLKHLSETEVDAFDSIRHKILTVLNIVQIIAEDPEKQSQVQETELLVRTMDAET